MAENRVQRRLAAILAADVVGYSSLMEQDEAGTLAAVRTRRKHVLEPLVGSHQGRIFKFIGDGVLLEFGSAVDAVQCAIELQAAMAAANDELPPDRSIVLRIGINIGDVIVEGRDLYGDGVNIAARLESLAEPGGICVSHGVYEQVRRKLACELDDLGLQAVKNMAEPVHVYRVRPRLAAQEAERPAGEPLPLPAKPSIAVLPFTNMGSDPEQGSFTDGLTEDLITDLSRNTELFVIARNSTFAYKDRSIDVRRIARHLGVRYLLEGSARRSAGRVRINVQLIDAVAGGPSLGRALRPESRGHLRRPGRGDRQDRRGSARPAGGPAAGAQPAGQPGGLRSLRARARPDRGGCGLAASRPRGLRPAATGDRPRSGLCRGAPVAGLQSLGHMGALQRTGTAEPAGFRRAGRQGRRARPQ